MAQLKAFLLLILWGIVIDKGFAQHSQNKTINKLVWVKGSEFTMGNPVDHYLYHQQRPLHQVRLADFYINQHEVTNEEFIEFLRARQASLHPDTVDRVDQTSIGLRHRKNILADVVLTPDSNVVRGIQFQPDALENRFILVEGREQYPVAYVTWYGAKAYCQWRYCKGNLPTEAQWEYAACGGQEGIKSLYRYAGNDSLDEVGWYRENANFTPHPVGQKKPNQLGLYDMSGNVWEWVLDHWHENYAGAPTNGRAWIRRFAKKDYNRVLRGGAWLYSASRASVRHRWNDVPDDRHLYKGFRCVCE